MTDSILLLHTSDWHLGAPDSSWPGKQPNGAVWVERLRTCREAAVRSIVELAIQHRVNAVLVAGDVLDQPELPAAAEARAARFLRSEVIEPLGRHDIRLVLTPVPDDWHPAKPERNATLRLLRTLPDEYPMHVAMLMPPGIDGARSLRLWHLQIATELSISGPGEHWIEFLHDQAHSEGGNPMCRCYGDSHILRLDAKRHRYYPGSPLARTTAIDGAGGGPRHVLLLDVGETPFPEVEALRLPVTETAVLRWCPDGWRLFYKRDYETRQWQPELLSGDMQEVARHLTSDFPSLGWVTFIAKDEPSRLQAFGTLGDYLKGTRSYMLPVWLHDDIS